MWELFLNPSNLAFSISLILMLFIGLVEILLLVSGLSSQGFLEQFLPSQFIEPTPDISVEGQPNLFIQLLDWLYLGRIPVLVWLIIFLTIYALLGFILQSISLSIFNTYWAIWIISPAVLFLSMPLVRGVSAFVARIIPKDETTAIHSDDFIGLTAEIILGEARSNYPAQAKLKDRFGQTHYILVEPESEIIFKTGEKVILTQRTVKGFQAISI